MKKNLLHLNALCGIVLCLALFTSCETNTQKQKESNRYRLIHNNDGTDALYNRWFGNKQPLSKQDIINYVDMVAGTQVTTYMMCSGSDFLYYRSKYGRPFGDDRNGELGCGLDTATLRVWKEYHQNILNLEAEGTDVIEASLLRAQEKGMEAFITYRVNDLHFADTSTNCPIHYSDFWMAHPEYWLQDSTIGWNSAGALDFAIPEVRQQKLNIIFEQLEKYEMIDGYDLDFMRFIVYFKPTEARQNAPLITEMIQKVKSKIDSLSTIRGKKILLSVRVPMSIETCLEKGLDVQEWARQGLVDFVSIGVHWRGEPAIPVAKFIADFGFPNIPVYATIDDGGFRPREFFSQGMHRGMASNILAQGADGIHLFNYYFGNLNTEHKGNLDLEKGGQVCRLMAPDQLRILGTLETLKNKNKIFCLTDGISGEYGMKQYGPLPLVVAKERICKAPIYIGDNPAENPPQEMILCFRTDKPMECKLWVNGIELTQQKPEAVELYDRARGSFDSDRNYAYTIPQGALKQGDNEVLFRVYDEKAFFVVKRLDVVLKYGEVETHGYF